MPRRRELRGAAFGLLRAFMSRNNDVGGYWALGKLCAHSRTTDARDVRIDLVTPAIVPPAVEFSDMVRLFGEKLVRQLESRRLPNEWLRAGEIRVNFADEQGIDGIGHTFECSVTLTDDLGHVHRAGALGTCWMHDPARERKSSRA